MRAISIADHDTVAAYPEAVELGRKAGVEVIPGIELTTLFGGREFHLLLPFVDWASPALASDHRAADRVPHEREPRARREGPPSLGLTLTMDEVRERSNGAPPLGRQDRPDPSRESREPGGTRPSRNSIGPRTGPYAPYMFYKEYFAEGRPAYVPKKFVGSARCPGGGPGDRRRARAQPPRRVFPADHGRRRPRAQGARPGSASKSTRSITRPSRRPSTGSWPRSSISWPRPAPISTAGSSPTSPSASCRKGTTGWSRS